MLIVIQCTVLGPVNLSLLQMGFLIRHTGPRAHSVSKGDRDNYRERVGSCPIVSVVLMSRRGVGVVKRGWERTTAAASSSSGS